MARLLVTASVALNLVLTVALLRGAPQDDRAVLQAIVQLYDCRVRAAAVELQSDRVTWRHERAVLALVTPLARTHAVSRRECLSQHRVRLARLEVDAGLVALREAQIQRDLIKVGVDAGAIDLHDLRIGEPRGWRR